MSFTITRVLQSLSPHVEQQVIDLAVINLTDISLLSIPPSNLMYPVYEVGMRAEIGVYISHLGEGGDLKVELILATDEQGGVVGFLMYLPVAGCHDACGVTYMAVSARHRRQGVARAMIGAMLQNYPHAGLSCTIEKVPYYEAMGFQVLARRDNQVSMNTRGYAANGLMGTLNVAPIFESPMIQQLQHTLGQKHGNKAMANAIKQIQRDYARAEQRVEQFVKERLARNGGGPV